MAIDIFEIRAHAKQAICVFKRMVPRRVMKVVFVVIAAEDVLFSVPRMMMWCKAPRTSTWDLRGMGSISPLRPFPYQLNFLPASPHSRPPIHRHCWPLEKTSWAQNSALLPYYTPGTSGSTTIFICIAWLQAELYLRIGHDGYHATPTYSTKRPCHWSFAASSWSR